MNAHSRKIDGNHRRVVELAQRLGAHVVSMTAHPGAGFDLLLVRDVTYIVEVKDGSLPPSHRQLTDGEAKRKRLVEEAGGQYWVIESDDDLLRLFGLKPQEATK